MKTSPYVLPLLAAMGCTPSSMPEANQVPKQASSEQPSAAGVYRQQANNVLAAHADAKESNQAAFLNKTFDVHQICTDSFQANCTRDEFFLGRNFSQTIRQGIARCFDVSSPNDDRHCMFILREMRKEIFNLQGCTETLDSCNMEVKKRYLPRNEADYADIESVPFDDTICLPNPLGQDIVIEHALFNPQVIKGEVGLINQRLIAATACKGQLGTFYHKPEVKEARDQYDAGHLKLNAALAATDHNSPEWLICSNEYAEKLAKIEKPFSWHEIVPQNQGSYHQIPHSEEGQKRAMYLQLIKDKAAADKDYLDCLEG